MTGFIRRASPVMIAIGGLSGSGKTTLAEEIGKRMPGTIVLDSDVFFKRLHGVDPQTPLSNEFYNRENIERFIRRIHREAKQQLKMGKNVIVTGTFLDTMTRQKQEELARSSGAEFIGIYLHASPKVLFDRVAKRKDTASDATTAVLKRQIKSLQDAQKKEAEQAVQDGRKPSGVSLRFRALNWQIINGDQPLEAMLHSAILYIHQEHQKFRLKLIDAPKKNQQKQKPAFKP